METAVLLDYEINDSNFKKLVDRVLRRVPDRYEDEFPTFSIYQVRSKLGAYVDGDNVVFDVNELDELSDGDDDVKIGIIAHELAHKFLNHVTFQNLGSRVELKLEDEADKLASNWGFAKEVEAFRRKLGPPTV